MPEPSPRLVEELFDRAVDLLPAEQAAFLNERCGGDADLRTAVEELLRLDRQAEADGLLFRSPVAEARRNTAATPAAVPPRFGRYRVVRVLGEGGMGTVYEAEQDNPRRTVALKVIRAGLASESLRMRFAREAQILGRLHHPGIAQVYDAGVAESGHPYFAMELVGGVPLDQYVREHSLDARGRLELVARVCEAVQHAHEGGIVHRDLKPGNILVEPSGQPKVIDFGVARAADAGRTAGGVGTEAGQLIGTLSYMSPEQASGDPSAIGPRGDVYALGVILYELLAYRLPYRLDGLPLPEAVRVIREQDPSRLGAFDGRLRGDVETIVAKAIEKDRTRRYASAGDLAADLRRHLSHEAIRARPPSALYQLRKFARRNRAIVAAAAGVMAALSVGTLVSAMYAVRADESAREARENARQARYQTYRANLAAAASALSQHDVAAAARHLGAAPEELRGWEWRHLHARLDDSTAVLPSGQVLRRGSSGIRVAAFGPTELVVTDEGGRRLFSTPWPYLPGTRPTIHFREDATWLAAEIVDRPDGVIRLTESSGLARTLRLPSGRNGADTLRFSPDGTRLAVLELNHSVSIWNVADGHETTHLARDPSNYNAMAFSDDGRRFAVAADSPVVPVWDTDTGRVVVELRTHAARVMAVAFHPRGERVLTASPDGSVHQWDPATGREVELPYERHVGPVAALAYSPDGLRVASAGADRTVRLWRATGRDDVAVLHGHAQSVTHLAFTADGGRLVSGDSGGALRLWETGARATLPVLRGHTSYAYPVTYSPDGRLIVSGGWDGAVRLWDAATGEAVADLPHGGPVRALALNPLGTRLAAMGDGPGGLSLWDVTSRGRVASFKVSTDKLWSVAYRPDGAHLAVLGPDHVIEILDAATGRRVATAETGDKLEHYAARRVLSYSPDGRLLAGPYAGHKVGLWDAETYRLAGTLDGHEGPVLSVAFSADGGRLASAGADSLVRVWDVESRVCLHTLRGHANKVFAAVFHPDGTRIASGGEDGLVRLWDTATGEELVQLPGHSSYVYSLAFSPDGTTLVSSSGDTTLRLWDTVPLRGRYRASRTAEPVQP